MKSVVFLLIGLTSTLSFANEISSRCYTKAEKAVATSSADPIYDENGYEAYECSVAKNNKVIICEVSASKGDGAAIDSFQVVLNRSCSKAYRVTLTGEE